MKDEASPEPEIEMNVPVPDELTTLRADRDKFRDLAQRERAEFENYQKRQQRDRESERKYSNGSIALDLLPVLDNLDRAMLASRQAGETGPLVEGVSMVQTHFLETLKRHGITRIDAHGKAFDPNLHQAIMQKPMEDLDAGTILTVVEQGFMNYDRVLRPAKVIVSSKG